MSRIIPLTIVAVLALSACTDRSPTSPLASAPTPSLNKAPTTGPTTAELVRELAAARGITAMPAPPRVRPALEQLGQALMFDPILSGNHDVACATCHLPAFGTSDGRSLSIGAGGSGLGPDRAIPTGAFIPRNAPAAFDLGVLRHMFWDGRVELDDQGKFHTPAGTQLTPAMARVFEFGAVSAQPMFPVTARSEMRGASGNELTALADDDFTGIWSGLMTRLGTIPKYQKMFEQAYPGTKFKNMNFAYASNAIAAFMVSDLTFNDSPWDRFLEGNDHALTPAQLEGARTFLTLKCSICHNGPSLSDDQFHNVAVAQFGPGQGEGMGLRDDFGRMNVTGNPADQYRFRTTSLRNVVLTGPYGHDGAFVSLRDFIDHYSNSDQKLLQYDPSQLDQTIRGTVLANASAILATRDTLLNGVVLTPAIEDQLVAYMGALTDPKARNLSNLIPKHVPSGLKIPAE